MAFKWLYGLLEATKIENPRKVPVRTLLKGTAIIMVAPAMLLTVYVVNGYLSPQAALVGIIGIFIVSIIFVRPYIANLSALTHYVEQLAQDRRADAPDLTFLNNVEELSEAVGRLHRSWEARKRQLETMLTESKTLLDSLPDVIILLDDNLDVVRTNTKAKTLFGYSNFDARVQEIIERDDVKRTAEDVLLDKKGKDIDVSLESPPRDYVVHFERFPIASLGGISLIVAMHDVTELKRTEQTFADFVANASHEIRTPLTSIIGMIETLQTTAKDDSEAQEKFLGLMQEQSERMSKLVRDLLSLSKIERNLATKPTEKVNINDLVNNAVKQVEWMAGEKDIQLESTIAKKLPAVIGDERELGQVLYNLLSNAIKYGSNESVVEVSVVVEKDNFPGERVFEGITEVLKIAVTDHGEGIAKEHLERLTERFYRVDPARSRQLGGTGLGLAIVKHILDRHEGVLDIQSMPEKGSTFTVYLPIG